METPGHGFTSAATTESNHSLALCWNSLCLWNTFFLLEIEVPRFHIRPLSECYCFHAAVTGQLQGLYFGNVEQHTIYSEAAVHALHVGRLRSTLGPHPWTDALAAQTAWLLLRLCWPLCLSLNIIWMNTKCHVKLRIRWGKVSVSEIDK